MNIHKLVEEELNSVLKEEQGIPAAQAPKEVVFKNNRKYVNSINTKKYAGKPLPQTIGLLGSDEGTVRVNQQAGFKWVHPEQDYKEEDMYWVKTSDPALIKKYSYQPKKPRPEVLELQQLMNKWLFSKLNPAPFAYRGMERSKRSEVNEDGLWGPISQKALDHIREIDSKVPKKGSGIPKILAYFKSIESQMVPFVTDKKPTPKPKPIPPEQLTTGGSGQSSSFTFANMQFFNDWVAKQKPENLANKTFAIHTGGRYENTIIKYGPDGKPVGEPQKIDFTPPGGKGTDLGTPENPLEESKNLRNMILKELMSALK